MQRTARRHRPGRWIDTALLLAAVGTCAATAIGLAARSHWIAELFTHFRVQYVAVQLAVMLALVARRQRIAASLIVPFLAVNVTAVADYWPSNAAAASERGEYTLMTANLNFANADTDAFIALVRDAQPDIVVVLEVTAAWSDALTVLEEAYPARYVVPREDPFGIGILARVPFTAIETIDLRGAPTIAAELPLRDGTRLRLVAAHLRPPVSRVLARERDAQLTALAALIGTASAPMVVTGDFNVTPYSPIFGDLLEATGLEDARRGRGFAITWPARFPIFGVPIDHCLVSEHVIASAMRRSGAFGSDHFAIMTSLRSRDKAR